MFQQLKKYFYCTNAATAIEYALIAAGISLAIVGVVFLFGDSLALLYQAMLPAFDNIAAEAETGR